MSLILSRIVRRSLGRILRRTELWNGNRETWDRAELPSRLAPPCLTDVSVVRLRSSAEADRWFASLRPAAS